MEWTFQQSDRKGTADPDLLCSLSFERETLESGVGEVALVTTKQEGT